MNSITQDMKFRYSLMRYAEKFGVARACIVDPALKLFHYTAIDEYSRYRILGAYTEQSIYSSADFLRKVVATFAHKGVKVECMQTDNGFEFMNRFSSSKRDLLTLFEATAVALGVCHKLTRPYTPRHNGKVERSHLEDQKRFILTLQGTICPPKADPIRARCDR